MIIFRICKFLPTKLFFLRIKPHHLFICSKIVAYWWGVTYNDVVPECYIITMDGLESEPFADVAPYIFEDMGRAYAVVKKQYRNTDLKKHVIGLNLVEIHSLDSVYQKFTWPMWECIESMHNGAILIKKARLIKQKVLSLHREHKQWPFTYVLDKLS